MGRQAADAGHCENRSGQSILGFTVRLEDADLALNRHIGHRARHDLIHADGDFLAPELGYVTVGILMLLHPILAREQIHGLRRALVIGGHPGNHVTGLSIAADGVDVELHAGNRMLIQRINLQNLNPARRGDVLNDVQNTSGIHIGAVQRDLPFLLRGMIAVRRADLPNGVRAKGNLAEHHIAVCRGGGLHDLAAILVKQAKHSPGQRLAVVGGFLQHDLVDLIPDDGIAGHLTGRIHTEGFHGHIERIAVWRIGFPEGVGAGNHGDIGNLAIGVRVLAIDRVAVLIEDLDQGTGQLFAARNIRLGQCDRRVDEMIQDGILHVDGDHILADRLIRAVQRDRILFGAQQPAVRNGDLLDVIFPVGKHAGEGQSTLAVCDARSHQCVGRQLLVISIGDDRAVVQAEDKAFASNHLHGLVNHAVLRLSQLQGFLLLAQGDADGQIDVRGRNLDLHNGCLLVYSRKRDRIGLGGKHIAVRRRDFRQRILAQGQRLGLHRTAGAAGQGFHQVALLVEDGALFTDNVLGSTQLKHRAGQIPVLKDRRHDRIAPGVGLIGKANQLLAGLFQTHIAADGCVAHIHGDGHGILGHGGREREAAEQHHDCQQEMKHSLHEIHRSDPP